MTQPAPALKPPPSPAERSASALEAIADAGQRIAAALERLSPPPAPVVDLNDRYGDPDVRFNPRDWKGENCKGRRFSQCPPDFLDGLAVVLDIFASTETSPKLRRMKQADAARARGWSQRIRSGWKPRDTSSAPPASAPRAAPPPPAKPPSAPPPSPVGVALGTYKAHPPVVVNASSAYPPDWDDLPEDDPDLID